MFLLCVKLYITISSLQKKKNFLIRLMFKFAQVQALDTLGNTEWRINKRVLTVMESIWAGGGNTGGLVDRKDVSASQKFLFKQATSCSSVFCFYDTFGPNILRQWSTIDRKFAVISMCFFCTEVLQGSNLITSVYLFFEWKQLFDFLVCMQKDRPIILVICEILLAC